MKKQIKFYKILMAAFFAITLVCITNGVFAVENNNNANLKSLFVDREGLDPEFLPDDTTYSLFVYNNVDSVKVDAIPEDENATVNITGNTNLKEGDNIINIDVTSADKSETKQYKIIVTKTDDFEKSNSYLLNLIVENATLSPNFKPQVFNYDLGDVSNDVTKLRLLVFPQDEDVPYTVTGNDELKVGDNEIVITVTSLDGLTTKTYTLNVHRNSIEKDEEVGETEPEIEYITTQNNKETNSVVDFIKQNKMLSIGFVIVVVIIIAVVIKMKSKNK